MPSMLIQASKYNIYTNMKFRHSPKISKRKVKCYGCKNWWGENKLSSISKLNQTLYKSNGRKYTKSPWNFCFSFYYLNCHESGEEFSCSDVCDLASGETSFHFFPICTKCLTQGQEPVPSHISARTCQEYGHADMRTLTWALFVGWLYNIKRVDLCKLVCNNSISDLRLNVSNIR